MMKMNKNWLHSLAAGALMLPLAANAQPAQDVRYQAGLKGEDPDRTFTAEPGDDTPGIEPSERVDRQNRQAPIAREQSESQNAQRQNARNVRPDDEPATLPAEFKNLKLTEEEETAMLRVIGQYDDQIRMLLNRFSDLHAQAIGIEAIPLAAKMREQGDTAIVDSDRPQQRTSGFRPGDAQDQKQPGSDQPAEQIKELSQQSPMAGPAAETWQKLHALHLEMVQAEAQKLVAIEKLLPEGKLAELHKHRAEMQSKNRQTDRPDLQNTDKNPEEERRDQQRERQQQIDSEIQIEQERNQIRVPGDE